MELTGSDDIDEVVALLVPVDRIRAVSPQADVFASLRPVLVRLRPVGNAEADQV